MIRFLKIVLARFVCSMKGHNNVTISSPESGRPTKMTQVKVCVDCGYIEEVK